MRGGQTLAGARPPAARPTVATRRPGGRLAGRALAGWVLAGLVLGCGGGSEPPAAVDDVVELDVGLSADERDELRFLSEGSNLVPVDLLRALEDPDTGRPMVESLERYGFLPSRASARNPYGLPVGWAAHVPEQSPNRLPYVGVNCAACHSGQIEYRGTRMRIDGAPNLADIEALGLALERAVLATLADPGQSARLVARLARLRHPDAGAAAVLLVPEDTRRFLDNLAASVEDGSAQGADDARRLRDALRGLLAGEPAPGDAGGGRPQLATALAVLERYAPMVRNRVGFGLRALRALEISPPAGPGRDDPWGLIRNLLFETETRLDAPTSIPHLFHYRRIDWFHADGNTTSVMQRNVAQAVALGAYVDRATGESTLLPRNLRRLEELWSRVVSPAWPAAVLGPVDGALAERGRAIFERELPLPAGGAASCADCHGSWRSRLVPLAAIGTDPARALSFAAPLDGRPFPLAVESEVGGLMATAFAAAGVSAEEARSWEYAEPRWRATSQYVARRLDGVWATAPYLHNGSVPTLADLLLPAAERPRTFPLGHREYDPERVGYRTDAADPVFVFDVTAEGNSNAGHEYGTDLSPAERRALVEYLKML